MKLPLAGFALASVAAGGLWAFTAAGLHAQPAAGESAADSASVEQQPSDGRREADLPFFRPLDEDEMTQALAFAEKNMPTFYGLWSRLPAERQRRMPPRMQLGFRLMFDARNGEDQRLYDVLAEQMKVRDQFMSLRREYRRSGFDEGIRQQLVGRVKQLVELSMKQRELRLEKMESMIKAEKAKLEADRANPEQLIESQYKRMEEETSRFVGFARRYGPFGNPGAQAFPGGVPTTNPTTRPVQVSD